MTRAEETPAAERVLPPASAWSVRPADLDPEERAALHEAATSNGGPHPHRRRIGELPTLVIVALVLAFLIKTFLAQAFYIPSGSMLETLQLNDRVLVEKVSYRLRDPERGEVIVFRRPGARGPGGVGGAVRSFFEGFGVLPPNAEIDLIKRVIGLPGERLELRDGAVYIDGRPLDEPYAQLDGSDFGPVTVPEGSYYMLGDNRANSDDSRFSLGPVPRGNVIGRAMVILWPPTRLTSDLEARYPGDD